MENDGRVVVLVLGRRLMPDGSPHDMLVRRMAAASKLFHDLSNLDPLMIVSGGVVEKGLFPGKPFPSEADVMKNLAVSAGVPSPKVILEDLALTTVDNFVKTNKLISAKRLTIRKLYVVTSEFHVKRSMIICRNILPHLSAEGVGHDSGLSQKQYDYELSVETTMIEKYRQRYPEWTFD